LTQEDICPHRDHQYGGDEIAGVLLPDEKFIVWEPLYGQLEPADRNQRCGHRLQLTNEFAQMQTLILNAAQAPQEPTCASLPALSACSPD
jgi:hypothetical protein